MASLETAGVNVEARLHITSPFDVKTSENCDHDLINRFQMLKFNSLMFHMSCKHRLIKDVRSMLENQKDAWITQKN